MNLYRKRKTNTQDLTVVDVVLIKEDELAPRAQWRIGRVLQLVKGRDGLVKGRDGLVRGAKLKVIAKGGAQLSVHRPFQRLIPFEIVQDDVDKHEEGDDNERMQNSITRLRPSQERMSEKEEDQRGRQRSMEKTCGEFANSIHSETFKLLANFFGWGGCRKH
jgi:hypothetical protein